MRASLFLDRFVVNIPLDTRLISGQLVDLNIRTQLDPDNERDSTLFRGSFLIEQATHIWNGGRKSGNTTLIVSRKDFDVPSTYRMKRQLMQ
jgi:hypothetical protein